MEKLTYRVVQTLLSLSLCYVNLSWRNFITYRVSDRAVTKGGARAHAPLCSYRRGAREKKIYFEKK